ncbi:hypothetical protein BJV77DRAFT_654063 [Russula vinacea]|nr:hypothetical protein BJV77DRAFT_654063 [Russula vinacea]
MAHTFSPVSNFLLDGSLRVCFQLFYAAPFSLSSHGPDLEALRLLTSNAKRARFLRPRNACSTFGGHNLNIMGAFIGIGLSTLARYIASLRPDLSASSRAIPAVFLVSIAFLAGWAKSRLPRLQFSALHAATSFLDDTVGCIDMPNQQHAILALVFDPLCRTVANAFSDFHECLSIAMDESFSLDEQIRLSPRDTSNFLISCLRICSTGLGLFNCCLRASAWSIKCRIH